MVFGMKTFRWILSVPLIAARVLAALSVWSLCRIGALFHWLGEGAGEHVLWPLIVATRIVRGEPRWEPRDLIVSKLPTTPEDLARADASPNVAKVMCPDPACQKMHYMYVPDDHPAAAAIRAEKRRNGHLVGGTTIREGDASPPPGPGQAG